MARRGLLALLMVATALAAGCDDEPDANDWRKEIASGSVIGSESDGVRSWKAIPYAAPPVGDLRWRPPRPPEFRDAVVNGVDYGPACLQGEPTPLSEALIKVDRTSEDCLTLNVHRPADDRGGLPVMVWIHGGAFVYGAGSQPTYNSPELVKRGVVLVTLNYRLGRLGFLAHPALESGDGRVANFGLLDQVAALQWVRDNIGVFGGDPGNVTVFGESAGGTSVNALMASPNADRLFDRAISESGLGREQSLTWDEALADGQATFGPLVGGDPSAADLRDLDAEDVMTLPTNLLAGQAPVLDDVLPRRVSAAFDAGGEARVPYLNGTTDLELPDAFAQGIRDPAAWRDELVGGERDAALAAYGDEHELDLHLLSDVVFTEPARHLALAHADDAPTYRYRFDIAPRTVLDQFGGAPHTAELAFVFDDTRRQGTPVLDADALADEIADLWVDFATDGEPNGWPRAETGQTMTFTLDGPVAAPDPWRTRLDMVSQVLGEAPRQG